mmetsp:Transcript_21239/g.47434  ORF Transcript_21239/g.47434 Transcript_21239/m.47434 type:complete len:106 (+) Transcript_21239:1143-1460(+)
MRRNVADALRLFGTWPMLFVDAIVLRPLLLLVAPRAKKGWARNKPAVTGSRCTTESEFGAEVGERFFARVVHPIIIYEPLERGPSVSLEASYSSWEDRAIAQQQL